MTPADIFDAVLVLAGLAVCLATFFD